MSNSWHSYPKVYGLGHAAIEELLFDDVVVEEKVDGSQFSFCLLNDELRCRSKNVEISSAEPDGMFSKAIETADLLRPLVHPGWTYRCEYLRTPKHNALGYSRVPAKHLILFDVNAAQELYLSRADKEAEAARLGLEIVPVVHAGRVDSIGLFQSFLERDSVLGGAKIEGVVIKNYSRFGRDGKALMGKFVSESFKETNAKSWRTANPTKHDIVESLVERLRTPARWQKAVQHMRDDGTLEWSPRDIGKLLVSAATDIQVECEDEIKRELFKWAWPHIKRGVTAGLPQWYKDELLKRQFDGPK